MPRKKKKQEAQESLEFKVEEPQANPAQDAQIEFQIQPSQETQQQPEVQFQMTPQEPLSPDSEKSLPPPPKSLIEKSTVQPELLAEQPTEQPQISAPIPSAEPVEKSKGAQFQCPECSKVFIVGLSKRPIHIRCPYCGLEGMID